MRIAISGHTGFIGSFLKEHFVPQGHTITGIGRKDYRKGVSHLAAMLEGVDVLVNLAGAPIVKRWTKTYSKILWDSRIVTTRKLTDAIAMTRQRPKVFISTSGVNIYENHGVHTENQAGYNQDFLGILCQRWEEEALRARIHCNTYIIRAGVVLGSEGGALPQMALPFKLFAGGRIGSGKQIVSWIHKDDYAAALQMIMEKLPDSQVFNFTSPYPATNAELSRQIAKTLNRPYYLPVPGFALKLLYGEGAVVLLEGPYALPENLQKEGFSHRYPTVQEAIPNLLDK
ncbi:MAG: TIGR01777 family oxidoreductase [Bacteroidota bacterium]